MATTGVGLTCEDFRPLGRGGFGDGANAYAHSMAWFNDRLYLGVTRHNLALLHMHDPAPLHPWPVWAPDDVYDLDLRGRILELDPVTSRARWVLVSPLVADENGRLVPRDIGYRGMTVVEGGDFPGGALFLTTWSPARAQRPSSLLCSTDGTAFETVSRPGTDPFVSTFRALVAADERLYCAPTGRRHGRANVAGGAIVLESPRQGREPWRAMNEPGLGDVTNVTVFELAIFEGHLWAGTLNPTHGFELWRCPLADQGPRHFTRVIADGAYRGNLNECAVSLCPFRGALYVGTGIQHGGVDRAHGIGPAAAEVLRVHPDGTFDVIVGESRRTPLGDKSPLSGLGPGFDDIFNGYLWRMTEYDGWLYAATYKSAVLLPYLSLEAAPPLLRATIDRVGRDAIANADGGFDLWRTADGIHWEPVTRNGFGNPYNFGARALIPTPHGLAVGTANPFGPHVAVNGSKGWRYERNARGGLELWLGRSVAAQNGVG